MLINTNAAIADIPCPRGRDGSVSKINTDGEAVKRPNGRRRIAPPPRRCPARRAGTAP